MKWVEKKTSNMHLPWIHLKRTNHGMFYSLLLKLQIAILLGSYEIMRLYRFFNELQTHV